MRALRIIGASVLLIAAVAAGCGLFRLRQVDSGICPELGKKLSAEDLRIRAIEDLLKIYNGNVNRKDAESDPHSLRLRIVNGISERDVAMAIFELRDGHDAFDEIPSARNLKSLALDNGRLFSGESFEILYYYTSRDTHYAIKTMSSGISVSHSEELQKRQSVSGVVRKLMGYRGSHVTISSRWFYYDCCSPMRNVSGGGRALRDHERHRFEYSKSGVPGKVVVTDLERNAYISNCGEILKRKDQGGYYVVSEIKEI